MLLSRTGVVVLKAPSFNTSHPSPKQKPMVRRSGEGVRLIWTVILLFSKHVQGFE